MTMSIQVGSTVNPSWKYSFIVNRNRLRDIENRFVVAMGRGLREVERGRFGLADASFYVQNG